MTTETTPGTPPIETPKVESTYDVMASVFDGLMTPAASTEDGDGEDAAATTPVDAAAAEAKAEGAASAAETLAAVEPPAVAAAPEVDWKAKFEELQALVKAAPAPAAEPAPATSTKVESESQPEIYSASEQEFLTGYEKEWPDVIKGEALRRRKEYGRLVDHVFTEIARVYGPLLERGAQAADTVAEDIALRAIQAVHKDYNVGMYNDVHAWVDTLSPTRKKLAKAVMEEGEPEEVVDLITEYKTATGKVAPIVVAGAAPVKVAPVASAVTDISAAAKKAAKALGVVDSKRSAATSAVADPNDFDAAWAEAVSAK